MNIDDPHELKVEDEHQAPNQQYQAQEEAQPA